MNTIRPNLTPNLATPSQGPGMDAAKLAAQKAFFAAATGQAPAPAAAAPSEPAPRAATVQRVPDASAEPPRKILRPGSLLDIRV